MLNRYCFFLMFVTFCTAGRAQVLFDNSYTNISDITDARETSDGGFIACGKHYSMGSYDMVMMKTDSAGNVQWIKTYGNTSDDEYGQAVIQTLDGGYLLAGRYSMGFLVKTDAAGVMQWQYRYYLGTQNGFRDIYELADSSCILTYSPSGSNQTPGFCRIDKNGTMLWYRGLYTVNANGNEINNVIPLSNGDFLALGLVMNSPTGPYESVVRFNSAGSVVWIQRYGYSGRFYSGCQTSDGNVVVCGHNGYDGIAVKMDPDGNVLWRHRYIFSSAYLVVAQSVVENPSGELLFLLKSDHPSYPAIVLKTDASGNLITSRELANVSYQSPTLVTTNSSLHPASDGSFVLGIQNSLKKIAPDLTSTCGLDSLNFTETTESVGTNNQPFTLQNAFLLQAVPFTEVPLTSVKTTYCSTTILSVSTTSVDPACNGQCTGTAIAVAAGGQAPYMYLWSPGGQTTDSVSNLCAGTYSVTVTDAGSSAVTSVITIMEPASISTSAGASSPAYCAGGCTDLNISVSGGTPGYAFSWMPGGMTSATPNVCPGTSTIYTCTITDANNCVQTDSVLITVHPLPVVTASAGETICAGDSATIGAGGADVYSWSPGNWPGSSVSVSPGVTTTYTVTGTDVNGCTDTATTTILVNALPAVSYVESLTMTCVNWAPVTLSAASPAGGVYSGPAVTGNNFDPAAAGAGTYDIVYTYTDTNGCAASDTSQITVDLCTGIAAAPDKIHFEVYPNPFGSTVTVVTDALPARIELYNAPGEVVYAITAQGQETKIDMAALPAGIYFICLITDQGIVTRKLSKE